MWPCLDLGVGRTAGTADESVEGSVVGGVAIAEGSVILGSMGLIKPCESKMTEEDDDLLSSANDG